MGIKVGIDLGTTFSAVSWINNDGVLEIINNRFDCPITPSVLCFEENGNILYGEDAKKRQEMGDINTVAFFKRNMGNDWYSVDFFGKCYDAKDLSAIFLSKIVDDARVRIGQDIDSAVITVPAYFTHKERQATIEAGAKAGLTVLAIINEPTAAAFAYGLNNVDKEQTILIYDLGGGTFDVTIASIDNEKINILGSDGNHELGGKDWDDCIARYLVMKFYEKYNIDISEDDKMIASLIVLAENIKKRLTSEDEVVVPIKFGDIEGEISITEDIFEEISDYLLVTTKEIIDNLMKSIGIDWSDITGTVLVGGSTRMRMIRKYIKNISGKEPFEGINVDEAVALGAAIRANIDQYGEQLNEDFIYASKCDKKTSVSLSKKVSDVTAHALGMIAISEDGKRYENSVIIPRNSKIPIEMKRSYKYFTSEMNNELEVYVLQGEHKRPLDNDIINKYIISKIEKTNANRTIIEVGYMYNSDGVVKVSAFQKETGKKLPIRIEAVPKDMSWTDKEPCKQVINKPKRISNVILAIDLSKSMEGEAIQKAKEALKGFVSKFDPNYTCIGLVGFADNAGIIVPISNNYDNVVSGVDNIQVGAFGTGTRAEPFSIALEQLSWINYNYYQGADTDNYVVVLTDGLWNYSVKAIKAATKCHSCGIETVAIGFGDVDEDFLHGIASMDEFVALTNLSELSGSFNKIAQMIGDSKKGLNIDK